MFLMEVSASESDASVEEGRVLLRKVPLLLLVTVPSVAAVPIDQRVMESRLSSACAPTTVMVVEPSSLVEPPALPAVGPLSDTETVTLAGAPAPPAWLLASAYVKGS